MNKFTILFVCFISCTLFSFAQPPCQNITANITATSPASDPIDTITIKVCKGTTVSFTGNGTFSNSGVGASYSWHFNDGTIMNGTSASRNFPNEGVYVVDFVVTDAAGCVNKNCNSRRVIQVSTTPHFNQTVFPDTVCINKPATLLGVVTPVTGVYNCAPPLSDTTFLPDGSGAAYSTSIHVSCFTPCDTVRTPADINSICLNMEHSYLGDLDIRIICPNGQQTILKDYNNGGNSAILGDPVATGLPVDSTNLLNPGIGFNYCFSPASTNGFLYSPANWTNVSPYTDPLGNVSVSNPINQVNAGTYQADGSWNNLVGCPLNGNWTIQVTDNLLLDNGYIFSWGIDFGQGLGNYSFTPTYPSQSWNANPDIVATSGATATIVPKSGGIHCYTFSVVDGFNCPYDTTICLYVQDPGNPGRDSFATICSSQTPVNPINYLAGNPTPGGIWSGPGISSTGLFDPLLVTPGDYEVQYKLTKGACDTVSHVKFKVANTYKVDFDFKIGLGCTEDTVHFHNLSDSGIYQSWAYGDGTLPEDTLMNPTHIYLDQDIYQVRLKSKSPLGCIDSAVRIVNIIHPLIAKFNTDIDSLCQTDGTPLQFNDASQGAVISWNWNFDDGGSSTLQNPTHPFSLAGNRQVKLIIHDAIPCYDSVVYPIYIDSLPFLTMSTDKHAICTGDEINLTANYLHPAVSLHWDFGDNVHWLENEGATHRYDSPGTYYFTATGHYPVCADVTATDSVVVSAFPKVNLGPDTVLCLDGPAITVSNLAELNDPSVTLLWNTGATTPSINIAHPGKYSLTATRNDCATTENIVVNKDCYTDIPNGFTPNGDGVNDYFYPRQLLSSGVTAFSMMVYDRWGQKIFETTTTDGRGWDGKFNGKDQPMGVYIYQIAVVLKNGRAENYNGNVTLVR